MAHEHDNHESHGGHNHAHHALEYKRKFFVSLIFGIPILLMAPMMGIELPFQIQFKYSETITAILASILFFYGAEPFLKGALDELKEKEPAMMMLVSMGISVSYVYSMFGYIANVILNKNLDIMDFFFELSSLILIMLLGHWLEMKSVASASSALEKIAELLPETARRLKENGDTESIPLKEVKEDDKLVIRAGESIPSDGIIIEGKTTVNEAMLTGESKDVTKEVDDEVIAGSLNNNGTITIRVSKSQDDSYLSQVMKLVEEASSEKSRSENLADLVAKYLFYFALIVGIITLIIWTQIDSLDTGIKQMVTVLVIACPHALGLAIPLVTARSTSLGAQNGLLVKTRQALESANKIDIMMMDKTGTLTEGNFEVQSYESFDDDLSDEAMLRIFASLENHSTHPLSVGVMKKAKEKNLDLFDLKDVNTIAGIGLEGKLDDQDIKITSVKYLRNKNIDYDEDAFKNLAGKGYSISFLIIDQKNKGLVALGDELKEGAKELIESLKSRNIETVMMTGDNDQVAQSIGKQLQVDTIYSEMMPDDKEKIVRDYKDKGKKVIMVGDGINDAPSLARADVGIAIGSGTDIASESADVILVKSNPFDILHFLDLAKNTTRKMKENLFWGAGYNFIAIPVAAGILAKWNIILTPAVGAVLMSISTVIVALNAMLLKIDK